MRRELLLLAIASGAACSTPSQSARTLPVGNTQITLNMGRTHSSADSADESEWHGELSVRRGLAERFDIALKVARTPGLGETLGAYTLDPKLMFTGPREHTAVSFGVPVGVLFDEAPDDTNAVAYFISPTVYVGHQASPTLELTIAPRALISFPDDEDHRVDFGGSIGTRFTDVGKYWAVHPELGFLRVTENGQSTNVITVGLGISAEN